MGELASRRDDACTSTTSTVAVSSIRARRGWKQHGRTRGRGRSRLRRAGKPLRKVGGTMMVPLLALGVATGCGQQPQKVDVNVSASAQPSAVATPTTEVPEYTSKKKLNPEEKQAAEDALVTVVKYEKLLDYAYAHSGKGMNDLEGFVTKLHFDALLQSADEMKKGKIRIVGSLATKDLLVEKVLLDENRTGQVQISGCIPYSQTKRRSDNKRADHEWGAKDSPGVYYMVHEGTSWLVDDMSIGAGKC